jgi:hypothetical protein
VGAVLYTVALFSSGKLAVDIFQSTDSCLYATLLNSMDGELKASLVSSKSLLV